MSVLKAEILLPVIREERPRASGASPDRVWVCATLLQKILNTRKRSTHNGSVQGIIELMLLSVITLLDVHRRDVNATVPKKLQEFQGPSVVGKGVIDPGCRGFSIALGQELCAFVAALGEHFNEISILRKSGADVVD